MQTSLNLLSSNFKDLLLFICNANVTTFILPGCHQICTTASNLLPSVRGVKSSLFILKMLILKQWSDWQSRSKTKTVACQVALLPAKLFMHQLTFPSSVTCFNTAVHGETFSSTEG